MSNRVDIKKTPKRQWSETLSWLNERVTCCVLQDTHTHTFHVHRATFLLHKISYRTWLCSYIQNSILKTEISGKSFGTKLEWKQPVGGASAAASAMHRITTCWKNLIRKWRHTKRCTSLFLLFCFFFVRSVGRMKQHRFRWNVVHLGWCGSCTHFGYKKIRQATKSKWRKKGFLLINKIKTTFLCIFAQRFLYCNISGSVSTSGGDARMYSRWSDGDEFSIINIKWDAVCGRFTSLQRMGCRCVDL